MSPFQRFAALASFLIIGSCGWAGLIFWLQPQGAPLWGFFFGIAWWEAAKMIWPKKSEVLPLLESAVAWRTPVVVDCGEQPVGIVPAGPVTTPTVGIPTANLKED